MSAAKPIILGGKRTWQAMCGQTPSQIVLEAARLKRKQGQLPLPPEKIYVFLRAIYLFPSKIYISPSRKYINRGEKYINQSLKYVFLPRIHIDRREKHFPKHFANSSHTHPHLPRRANHVFASLRLERAHAIDAPSAPKEPADMGHPRDAAAAHNAEKGQVKVLARAYELRADP